MRIVSTEMQSFDDVEAMKEQWRQEAENDSSEIVVTIHGWFVEQCENFEICPACYK